MAVFVRDINLQMDDFWVFGYGSLMWNPGFRTLQRQRALLFGLHRSLCVHSWVHRGTPESPGLVLGLDNGGSCNGIALKAAGTDRGAVIDYLRKRELVTSVYLECWRNVLLETGEKVPALVYRVDRRHRQYAPGLSPDSQAEIVRRAKGGSGDNREYVLSTVSAMNEAGIRDCSLEHICKLLQD